MSKEKYKPGDVIKITGVPLGVKNLKQLIGIEPIGYQDTQDDNPK